MQNMRVVFMGTPEFSVPVLEGLIAHYSVVGVVTQPDKETGRHKTLEYSPIKKVALEHGIAVLQPKKIREEYEEVLALQPDCIVTCAYGQIIPKVLLDYPKYHCINVHASLLPKLRGGAPIHRAIMNGEKKTGITIMYMDEGMDSGDILTQEEVEIPDTMTTGELQEKLSLLGKELLLKSLPAILEGKVVPKKQEESLVTFGKIIKREDELLDFSLSTKEVYNKIRGLSPEPGAYAFLDGKIVKIYQARCMRNLTKALPGEIVNLYKDGIGVKTYDGEIVIEELKIEGKKKMSANNFLNGVKKDELLGKKFTKE